jgi:SAM-dependent methyltransferase
MTTTKNFARQLLDLQRAHVLVTAVEAGLLERLCRGPATAAELANQLALAEPALVLMLGALSADGVVLEREGCFEASPALIEVRDRSPGGLVGIARVWGHLPTFVASGQPLVRCNGSDGERQRAYAPMVAALAPLFEPSAEQLARRLADDEPTRVLDVGAGSGVWGLALAARCPRATVTALDLPAVLPSFVERAERLGLSQRVQTLGRSYTQDPLSESRYDVVILASVLHLENEADAASLVARAAAVLAPGGVVVLVDQLGGEGVDELTRQLYALHLAMRTRGGTPHRRARLLDWLEAAGLHDVVEERLELPGLVALIAS